MEMLGNRHLGITQQQAWEALNDPETLKKCIPGCDKFELTGDNTYSVALALKIGPVSAKFQGKVMLSDIVAPDGYKLTFEGQGGVAGFAKGASSVTLRPLPSTDRADTEGAGVVEAQPGCELAYTVQATVGGKIAQLGQRLIDGAAKSTADDFFKRFEAEMQSRYGPPPAAQTEDGGTAPSAEKTGAMAGFMKKIGLGKKADKDAAAAADDAPKVAQEGAPDSAP
ncbi:carbon monoxide dehydrogenase subunit G [Variovorax sp. RTB1]|uniref:CoxG family protein n=1 Tax=Variovorax sp. RTB1 TaxID=3048631 RepID=UPI002B22E52B|nr:carbon monoxide dehydrogenase subunit G [Variovorax sp. RTB1]MEB0112150.1 carbon monoxide dehydrogenase subunit G [Variovorax sp. RTB1]